MGASVKIMLSYDYCHFEVSKSTDENISDKKINELRKDVQRLADEAVRQYKMAKEKLTKNEEKQSHKEFVEERFKKYSDIPESERSEEQKAFLKKKDDESFMAQFEYQDYDYEDDDETYDWEDDE